MFHIMILAGVHIFDYPIFLYPNPSYLKPTHAIKDTDNDYRMQDLIIPLLGARFPSLFDILFQHDLHLLL